jgi:hypothetical protein
LRRSLRAALHADTTDDRDIPSGFRVAAEVRVALSEDGDGRWMWSRPHLSWHQRMSLFRLRSGDGPVLMLGADLLWTLGETHVLDSASVGGPGNPTIPARLVDQIRFDAWSAGESAAVDTAAVASLGAWVPLSPRLQVVAPVAPTRVFLAAGVSAGWLDQHVGSVVHPLFDGHLNPVDPTSEYGQWIWGVFGRVGLIADLGGSQAIISAGMAGPGRFGDPIRATVELSGGL